MGKELVPEIRFEGFTGAWEQRKLGEFSKKITTKNADGGLSETFTNSAEQGVISQLDYFDHDITNDANISGYYVVQPDNFVYNPRVSVTAPCGPINRNRLNRAGVMSPLYTVFSVDESVDKTYLEHYFKTSRWHDFMFLEGNSGARSDRFSISDATFFEMPIWCPKILEQRAIAKQLETTDSLITLHQRKYEALRAVKSSMLDKMFPKGGATEPELRFDGFTGPWERVKLSDVYRKGDEKNSELEFGFDRTISVSNMKWNPAGNGAASSSLPTYKILRKGDIAFEGNRTKGHPYGKMVINDIGDGIMSSRFRTIAARGPVCIRFWKYYLLNDAVFRPIYIRSTKRGTLMTELVTEELLESELLIPSSEEQELIGGALNAADKQIVCEATNLATLKQLKAALLDKMFPKGAR